MLANTNKLYRPAVTENLCIISIFISPLAASPKRIKKRKRKRKTTAGTYSCYLDIILTKFLKQIMKSECTG
jgi:hypothetical protein